MNKTKTNTMIFHTNIEVLNNIDKILHWFKHILFQKWKKIPQGKMRLEPSPKRYTDTNLTSSVSNAFNALQMIEISFHELNKFEARSSWVTEGKYDCIVAGSPGELMDLSPTPNSRVCWKSLQEKYTKRGKHDLH